MKYLKFPFQVIKNTFLNSSIQSRIILFFLTFIFLFSIAVIEYIHFYFKKKLIEKLENDLQNLVEISYNSVIETFSQMDQGIISYEKAIEILKKRFNGPIESLQIILNKDINNSLIQFFNILDIKINTTDISIIKEDNKIKAILIESLGNQNIFIFNYNRDQILLQFPTNLAEIIYYKFINSTSKTQEEIINKYKIRFIRNINKASIKIGKDGYVYIIQSYNPEWLLPNTKFPDDYTLEKIRERFSNHFKGHFNSNEDYKNYLNTFGKTPEEQYQYINNYMHSKKKNPDPAIAIVHPYFEFVNLDNVNYKNIYPVRHIVIQKNGFYRYPWKNPVDNKIRTKVAYLKHFEYHNYNQNLHINWVIGIGAYEDESYFIVNQIRKNLYIIFFIFIFFVIFLYYYFIRLNLIKPLNEVIEGMKKVNEGNYKIRLKVYWKDEIAYIASTFNFMVRSIRKKNKELENYANNLKEMVENQTKQLKETILEINQLKEIQDGDYYLTSLLLKQLGQNLVHSENVKIEFFVKQIKEFEFRNKRGEIGGDICIARTIFLREHPYIFFLNADAMGKSMQGAAGSLILGSVMESILERTIQAFIFKNYSPERWLKNSFMELKHIFESFHGSMGATMVMGLIDENTGTMYYINAEHPPGILYRNQNALFFHPDFHFQRLGITEESENKEIIYIQTFSLLNDDIIIFGSDGKDDIKLKNGNINHDEYLILNIIEECEADLEKIYRKMIEIGELTDDLSLLKIHFNSKKVHKINKHDKLYFLKLKKEFKLNPEKHINDLINFYKNNPNFTPCLKLIIQYYASRKEFTLLYNYAINYFELKPADNTVLYLIFYSLYQNKHFDKAIEFGERYYLRNPTNVNLLVQLAECYFKINQFARSEYLIEKALNLEPENEKIKRFIKKLKQSDRN
ncbi:MAG: hypothetical protein KatS3mg129_2911 [Leptospiraceae bacterium]|nr:MAG: hypothetical protein KatS3mg129_2911 [Leptospiraceae bacterium]